MRDIKGLRLAVLLAVLAWSGYALAQDALPPQSSPTPDPAANNGVNFTPQAVTAGTAIAGVALGSVQSITGCTPLNPCAVPSPALDDLPAPPPAAAAPPAEKNATTRPSRGPGRGAAGGRRGGRFGDFARSHRPTPASQP